MQRSFGDYLKTQRNQQQLSQEQLAVALEQFDGVCFKDLTDVTVCNWEKNVRQPALTKIQRMADYFGDDPLELISSLTFTHTAGQHKLLAKLYAKIDFSPKGRQIGCFPIHDGYQMTDLTRCTDTELMQLILAYDQSIYQTEHPVTPAQLKSWTEAADNLCYACTYKGHYFGHLIALRVKCEVFAGLLAGNQTEADIAASDFIPADQMHCLYVYSIYAANKSLAAILLLQCLQHILLSRGNCKQIGGLCSTADGIALAKTMGLKRHTVMAANATINYRGQQIACATFGGQVLEVLHCVGVDMLVAAQQFNIKI